MTRGAGGTEGGIGQFFGGLLLAGLGFYLFLERVNVTTNFASIWGGHFGLVLLPLGFGIARLFFDAKSVLGWALTLASLAAVVISILANLTFYFQSTNLFRTAGMIALIFIGFGMMIRSFRSAVG